MNISTPPSITSSSPFRVAQRRRFLLTPYSLLLTSCFLLLPLAWLWFGPSPVRADGPPLTMAWSSSESNDTACVAWGDYDGDGDLDLAVGNYDQRSTVYRNDGGVLAPIWSTPGPEQTTSLAWGDYDGDGDLDLAVGDLYFIQLYSNDDGDLSFSAVWSSGGPASITSLAWGDVDGDGDLDLAVGNYGQPNQLYLNDGGTLTFAWSPVVTDTTTSLAWGDYDYDGDLDLAVGNIGLPNRLYRNDGGMLATSVAWSSVETDTTRSLAWGDYDGDGDLDLAVGNYDQPVRLYRNDNGFLKTSAAWSSVVSDTTRSVAWGDYDGDGDLDLAAGNYGQPIRLYRNDGGALTSSPAWSSAQSDQVRSLAWGDYDGDGDLDLAAGNYGQPSRLYRNDSPTLSPGAAWSSDESGPTHSLAWGDYDGDGDLDLAAGNVFDSGLYRNDDGALTPSPVWTSTIGAASLAWGDYDGDGDLDLGADSHLYRNDGGALTFSPVWTSTESSTSLAWGDYDGDGDLDLASGNNFHSWLYRNDGGTLASSPVWSSTEVASTRSVAWGDVDGDGDLDLAVGIYDQPNRLYRNDNGTLIATAVWSSTETDATTGLAWGDYDGDGDLDLAAGNRSQPNRLYRNDGGTLTASAAWSSLEADLTYGLAWGDYDGDGDLDLATGNWRQPARLYHNDHGTLAPGAAWSSLETYSTTSVAWGDVDGDGDLDLATGSEGESIHLYRNNRDARLGLAPVPLARVFRPAPPDDADFYSTGHVWAGPSISISYTLFHLRNLPVRQVAGFYSLDGGGAWLPAVASTNTLSAQPPTGTASLDTATYATYNYTQDVGAPIPDRGTLTSTMALTPVGAVADIDVSLTLTHTSDGQLYIALISPAGQSILLSNGRGSTGDDFTDTVFDDEALTPIGSGSPPFTGSYRPRQPLAVFDGQQLAGTWALSITDRTAGESGGLVAWGMTATLASGITYTYTWDVASSGLMGRYDNVVFRLVAVPEVVTRPNQIPGPYLYGSYAANTFPFRVRGSQVQVMSGTVPISDAIVYRLPAGQTGGGASYADAAGNPFRTDSTGYLQGHGPLGLGDQLLALAPASLSLTYTQRYSDALHLYYTNGTPTEVGLDTPISNTASLTVSQPGVQVLDVSAAHPLLLFDLHMSLEWDAQNDPIYRQQLEFDLKKASQYLYDFSNGRAALGRVTVYQAAENWKYSDVLVHSTNRLRPFAVQGGVVLTRTLDPQHPDIVYDIGQIRMGATWNRYGNPGQMLGLDWPLALAHELSHYLFFLDDVYLGLDSSGRLIPVDTCTGSAMGDMYDPSGLNTEFLDADNWLAPPPKCADTLAHKTLGRSEWETMGLWYPWLAVPGPANSGPAAMPFDLTPVTIFAPLTPTNTLTDPTFYLDYAGGAVSSSEGRAFLLRADSYVFDLGSPVGGQNRVLARGARPGDRLCVFDSSRYQYGCEIIESGDERLSLERDESWTPLLRLTPVTSSTPELRVEQVPPGLPLRARLYPEYGEGSEVVALAEAAGEYSGTFSLSYPTTAGHLQVWVDEPETEMDPRREVIVAYAISGNLGNGPAMRGGGPATRGGGPATRGGGPATRGGGPAMRGGGAPLLSSDGQMTFFAENPAAFAEETLYTVQSMAGLPSLPAGKKAIGPSYNLVASSGAPAITGSVSFQYLGSDTLTEGVSEDDLTVHFWDGSRWRTLETTRSPYYNLASAASRGPGVYALLAGTTTPAVAGVIPSAGVNDVTNTLVISGGYFLELVEVALVGPTTTYTLSLQAISPYSITAVVTQGLPAGEYRVQVVNYHQPGGPAAAPAPGLFALYDPAEACFYDFFRSGTGKWQRSDDWDIVTIAPSGEQAMTDSPAGPYKNAGDYGSGLVTYTTQITSVAFSLADCTRPVLTFRHDYALAQMGASRDVGRLEISTDDGLTWVELSSYTGGGIFGAAVQGISSPEWDDAEWRDARIDLGAYAGAGPVRLRFSLEVNDDAVSSEGWVLDDVMVITSEGSGGTTNGVYLPVLLMK